MKSREFKNYENCVSQLESIQAWIEQHQANKARLKMIEEIITMSKEKPLEIGITPPEGISTDNGFLVDKIKLEIESYYTRKIKTIEREISEIVNNIKL